MKDITNVFMPADKVRLMVAMTKYERDGGEKSYESKTSNQ